MTLIRIFMQLVLNHQNYSIHVYAYCIYGICDTHKHVCITIIMNDAIEVTRVIMCVTADMIYNMLYIISAVMW